MQHLRRPLGAFAAFITAAGFLTVAVVATPKSAHAAEVRAAPASGAWTVDGHGNGHGHGLSQYGARGAAIAGLNYSKILAFYYPNTVLATSASPNIRVLISGDGGSTVWRSGAGQSVTGVSGALPTNGDQWRLVPRLAGYQLQQHTGFGWNAYRNLTATTVDVRSSTGALSLSRNGAWAGYRGMLSAVRSGSGSMTVNTLNLESYLRGVVPSEMPASWQAAAVQAQAVAARSYSRYFVVHPRDPSYDICDTTACQVYGGMSHEAAGSDAAIAATANRVLTYGGSVIFAEFSASNGGMTSSGNQPYFVTKPDPYDNAASGDPYLNWTESVPVARVAAAYNLDSVGQIQITAREGGGQWGGLVKTAVVNGVRNGTATSIDVTGAGLASAMGLSYRFFYIRPFAPRGHVDSTSRPALHTVRVTGWTLDANDSSRPTPVDLELDGVRHRSTADLPRPDVQRAFGTVSPNHGFGVSLTVPGGNHRLCTFAVALNGVDRTALGCSMLSVPVSPLGHVDTLAVSGTTVRLSGWTFDPDVNGGPGRVHVYVDGAGYPFDAASARADVQRAYGLANSSVGFSVAVPLPAGTHRVCAYGINRPGTSGANTTLLCKSVSR
jgi:SpoIID/LytB domain protein